MNITPVVTLVRGVEGARADKVAGALTRIRHANRENHWRLYSCPVAEAGAIDQHTRFTVLNRTGFVGGHIPREDVAPGTTIEVFPRTP
jgi:hypothetical protein